VSDAPPTGTGTLTDAQVLELLRDREEKEEQAAQEAAQALSEGSCPVCEGALLSTKPFWAIAPFVERMALACSKCDLTTQHAPTWTGWALAIVIAATCALGGMSAIFSAQRIPDPRWQKMVFLGGALLFAGGMFLGYGVHGAGSAKSTASKILAGRRREAAKATASSKEAPLPQGNTWFQENLEAVVVAVILALIIRHFAMEAFVIPTGSMAPTLLGDHFEVTCDACGHEFPISKNENEFHRFASIKISAQCPLCGREFQREVTTSDVHGGHKILVNKFSYTFGEPQRFDVIVFKFPGKPWRNYIKRLVGLPGETLEVRNGDLWVDGRLARKPDRVQDSIWIPVHDAAYPREQGPPRWRPLVEQGDQADAWSVDSDGVKAVCYPKDSDPTWLAYSRKIFDDYGYNRGFGTHSDHVADLRVRARVTPRAGATVRLALVETSPGGKQRVVAARFPVGSGEGDYAIEVDGREEVRIPGRALAPDRAAEVALSYADDRARLLVDGETVIAWEDPYGPEITEDSSVRVAASGAETVFEQLRIDRDVYYRRSSSYGKFDPSNDPLMVPEGSYFVMGDNSPNSEDGRKWGFVREGHMIGRSFMVFWPPSDVKLIR